MLTVLLIIYLFKYQRVFWKQISLIVFSTFLLPHVSYDYKLIFILIPIMAFITSKDQSRFDLIYATLFGLMIVPKTFWIIAGEGPDSIWVGSLLNPLILTLFSFLIISDQSSDGHAHHNHSTSLQSIS